jgi:hypothetical protein
MQRFVLLELIDEVRRYQGADQGVPRELGDELIEVTGTRERRRRPLSA